LINHTGDYKTNSIDVENDVNVDSYVFTLEISKPEAKTEARQQKRVKNYINGKPSIRDIIKITTIDFVSHVILCPCVLNILLCIENESVLVKLILTIRFGYCIKAFSRF
jgi:hypothetical protein